jgi:hypothetical protein
MVNDLQLQADLVMLLYAKIIRNHVLFGSRHLPKIPAENSIAVLVIKLQEGAGSNSGLTKREALKPLYYSLRQVMVALRRLVTCVSNLDIGLEIALIREMQVLVVAAAQGRLEEVVAEGEEEDPAAQAPNGAGSVRRLVILPTNAILEYC